MLAKSIFNKLKTVNPRKSTNKLCLKEDPSWPKPFKVCLNPIIFLTHFPSLAALCCEPLVPIQAAICEFINMHVLFHKCWMVWKCCIRFAVCFLHICPQSTSVISSPKVLGSKSWKEGTNLLWASLARAAAPSFPGVSHPYSNDTFQLPFGPFIPPVWLTFLSEFGPHAALKAESDS